ncbi:MAG: flavin reductase family protein [Clostridia bacterium]|nr:flavin reductase family protein [Clostridia bacterium]MBQ7093036.1 flavin reductase family protein [Clostridia bacterium]
MRKNFGAKPILYPQPVFIIAAYDENGKANAMNAAWGGVADANKIMICISPGHKTTKNILLKKEFTVSMGTADQVVACDYVGMASGNDVPDKMEKAGFHTTKAEFVDAPVIDELPMALECKLLSYDTEEHILIAEVVNVNAEESILGENGKIDVAKLRPIVFDAPGSAYCVVGEKVGNAFKDGAALK